VGSNRVLRSREAGENREVEKGKKKKPFLIHEEKKAVNRRRKGKPQTPGKGNQRSKRGGGRIHFLNHFLPSYGEEGKIKESTWGGLG